MQNTTEITGLRLSQRLEELVTSGSYPVMCLWYAVGAAVSSMARIVGGAAPFGIAFAAAVPFRFTLPSTLGMAVGYLACCGIDQGYRYIAAGLLVTLLRWLLRPTRWDKHQLWLVPLSASAAMLVAAVLPLLYSDPLLYDMIMWGTQVVIAGAAASFLHRALALLDGGSRTATQDTALWVLFSIAIMGLCTIEYGGVSAGGIAAAAAVLLAARIGGVVAATMTGVICGFAAGFAAGSFTLSVTLYSLGGLMGGVFGAFGRVGSAIAFTAAYGFIGMLAGGSPADFAEVAIAAVIFLMIPQGFIKVFAATVSTQGDAGTVKTVIGEQLCSATTALRDLSRTTADVAHRLGRLYTGDIGGIYDRVGERVCRKCTYNPSCWQNNYSDTVDCLAHGLRKMMSGGRLEEDDLVPQLSHCPCKSELVGSLTAEYGRYSRRDEQQRHTARIRRLMSDQIEGIALALEDIGQEIDNIHSSDSVLEARAEAVLEERHLEPQQVLCWRNRMGRLTIRVEIPEYKEARSAPEQLSAELGEAAGVTLTYPVITRSNKLTRMVFCERPRYSVEYGSCQLNCGDGKVCGDSFRILGSDGTSANLLLSDGMGSGNNAAVDSAMAAALAARLLEAGISYQSTLKLINGALLVKSGDESLATLDAAHLDLYTGKVEIYKAGAAPSVVRRDGRGLEIDSQSLPAGILEGVEFHQSKLTLADGDLLLMLSDGAVPDGSEWIARAVESFDTGDLNEFCRKLAASARLRRTDSRDDDITVLCCRLIAVPQTN